MDRPFKDLSDSGLLWLINRTVFHPRGYALALTVAGDGEATGWSLLGDGSEPWQYGEVDVENDKFRQAEATLKDSARPAPRRRRTTAPCRSPCLLTVRSYWARLTSRSRSPSICCASSRGRTSRPSCPDRTG